MIENTELSNTDTDPNTENILIHGDNLLALKALEPMYAGQIKCIYIVLYVNKNDDYWIKLSDQMNNYCEKNKIKYINYFYHKKLVEKKKVGIKNG